MSIEKRIQKAQQLEQAGLWRRAAMQWLAVMDRCTDDAEGETLAQRRQYCLMQLKGTPEEQVSSVRNRHRCQVRWQARY
ncbi:PerC family transcriptional regulator [Yersinia intermedia]|uniref:PerC family transcriptional regulator n=2 Tax=Yersinia intermedia TaxID=631 RepID=UPI0021BD91C6|nr:PerC family transcriptional regulator [Yersinia intermedia]